MITLTAYKGKKVGVFGLGKAGEATLRALVAGGAHVFAWDDKLQAPREEGGVQYTHFNQWPWGELACLVLSPGVPLTHPKPHAVVEKAHAENCAIIGDIELLYQACPQATYVGITGTNGKSTTTTLIAHILKSAGKRVEVGGNLGTPVLAFAPLNKGDIYVVECSSYQLDLVKTTRFNVACLLNITPDHLDRHGDMNGYVLAKRNIFARQKADDVAVIAVEDAYTQQVAEGMQHVVKVTAQPAIAGFDISGIPTLTGKHNWQNAAVAWAACHALGISGEQIYAAMKTFPGLAHRLEMIATINGVRFINDSKATNAEATANALAPFENIYWIIGGKAKAGGIETLGECFPKVAHAFLIGDAAQEFARTLEGKVAYTHCGTLDKAVEAASAMAFAEQKNGAVVLLSPACASFDQFKNFEERGDAFRGQVQSVQCNTLKKAMP